MPYKGNSAAMLILLPHSIDGLGELESHLSAKFLAGIVDGMGREAVEAAIPKFKFSAQFGLAGKLKEMGMAAAFTAGRADFSGIDGEPDLYISAVEHKAFIAVDEQGPDAAAATGIVLMPSGVMRPQMTFTAYHRFIFVIRDGSSGGGAVYGEG